MSRRNLGHLSPQHEMGSAIKRWFDTNDLSGSAISQVFESRLDDVEDSQETLANSLNDEVARAKAAEGILYSNHTILSSSVSVIIGDLTSLSSSVSSSISTINTDVASLSSSISTINTDVASLSSSVASLSQSFTLLSASIGSGGGLAVSGTAELSFNGDTLMTDADIYISGSGNNLLLTHADIYVTGSNNYLYLNGTDENGDYGIFYFDIVSGSVYIKHTGSI